MNEKTKRYLWFTLDSINSNNLADHVEDLVDVIQYHNKLYYEEAKPIISDWEYDLLFRLLVTIEEKFWYVSANSPTKKIWWITEWWFKKANHKVPLISLANSYNADDLHQRHESLMRIAEKEWIKNWSYIVEPKLDGSSVEVIYKLGKFSQAITRGDWSTWEDITENVRRLRNIPLYIERFSAYKEVHLRWEILMPKNSFEHVNSIFAKNGEALFANPRNAAAWTLRQLDSNIVFERGLVLFIYDVLWTIEDDISWEVITLWESHNELLQRLNEIWLPIYQWSEVTPTIEGVINTCNNKNVKELLDSSNIEMDWLVIKVDNLSIRSTFGETEHHPRRAIAYKFPTKQIAAKINAITYQVGRTWVITPVAELDAVSLGWVTVSRATLHNFDYINERDIRIGDRVRLQRSWEVIPYIIWPIIERREWSEKIVTPLLDCPYCSSKLEQNEGEVAIICTNSWCKAKLSQQVQHFVSKNCLNISWLWNSIVDMLVESNYIASLSDLYTLNYNDIWKLPWMGEKKVLTMREELHKSKTKELRRRIHWVGIKYVWKKTSMDLEKSFTKRLQESKFSWENTKGLLDFFSDVEYLRWVHWIWEQIIISLSEWASKSSTIELLSTLLENWVTFNVSSANKLSSVKLKDLKFVITWSFSWYSRDTLASIIVQNWWEVVSTVSKNTNYLLSWEKAGSKLKKATEIGVTIITLQELWTMIWEIIQEKNTTDVVQSWLF